MKTCHTHVQVVIVNSQCKKGLTGLLLKDRHCADIEQCTHAVISFCYNAMYRIRNKLL